MLIGFLIRDENDWHDWRQNIQSQGQGEGQKPIINVADRELSISGHGSERESAVDEVEILSDDDDEDGDGKDGVEVRHGDGDIGGEVDVITISGSEI